MQKPYFYVMHFWVHACGISSCCHRDELWCFTTIFHKHLQNSTTCIPVSARLMLLTNCPICTVWGTLSVWDPESSDVCWAGCQERQTTKESESDGGGRDPNCRLEILRMLIYCMAIHIYHNVNTLLCLCVAANQKPGKRGRKSVFDEELTNTSRKSLKNYRAGWDFEICLFVHLSV